MVHCNIERIRLHRVREVGARTEVGVATLHRLRERKPILLHAQQKGNLIRRAGLIVEQLQHASRSATSIVKPIRATRRTDLRRERPAPDLPRALRDLRVAHLAPAEALELLDDAPAHRVVRIATRVRRRWLRAHDLRARPVLQDRVRLERQVRRDAQREQVQVPRGQPVDQVCGRELCVSACAGPAWVIGEGRLGLTHCA